MRRRKWQPDEKLAIVMEGLKDGSNGGQSQEVRFLKNRTSELERIIGKLTIQIEILKKTEEMINR